MKIINTLTSVIIAFAFVNALNAAITITSGIDSDVYHYYDTPTSTVDTLGVSYGVVPFGPTAGDDHSQTSLVKFATSTWTGTVDSATLRLYSLPKTSPFGSPYASGTIDVRLQYAPWSVDTVNQAAISPSSWSVGTIDYSSDSTWYELDVTSIVQSWTGGTPNYGFVLQAGDTDVNMTFASFETGFAPELVVTGTAVPEPSTYALILGLFTFGFLTLKRRK